MAIDNKPLQTQFELLQNISKQYEVIKKAREVGFDFSAKEEKLLKDGNTELEIRNERLRIQTELYNTSLDVLNKQLEISIGIKEKLDEKSIAGKELTKEEEEQLRITLELEESLEREIKFHEEKISLLEKGKEIVSEGARASRETVEETKKLLSLYFGINEEGKRFADKVIKQGFGSFFKSIGQGLKEVMNPINIAYSGIEKIQEATAELLKEQENAIGNFNKSSGAAGKYNDMIRSLGHDHLELGIDSALAAKSILSLREGFSSFSFETKETQKELSLFAASMEQLGIDSQETAKFLNLSVKSLGMTTEEAMGAQREILSTSQALGMAPSKMVSDYGEAMKKLSAYGKESITIFKQLSATARATGMEVSDLLNITEQFETFESSANAVGKLNAVLRGPYLDSIQMVMMSENERMKALKGAVLESGMSWDTMEKYQRKAVASAMGLSNVSDLQKILTGDVDEYIESIKTQTATQEEMNKTIKESQNVFDKMKQIVMSFAISLGPLVDKIKGVIETVMEWNKALGGYLMPALVGVATVFGAITFAIKAHRAATLMNNIAIVASAMAKGTESAALVANTGAIGANSAATQVAGKVAGVASVGLFKLGAAILMIGVGIGLVLFGIYAVIKAMTGFVKMILDSGKLSYELGGQLAVLGASMLLLLPGGIAAAGGMTILALGLGALSLALATIKTDDLKHLSVMFESISKFSTNTASFLKDVASSIREMAKAIDEIPSDKSITFTSTMANMSQAMSKFPENGSVAIKNMIETSSTITEEKANNVKKLVDQAERYQSISEGSKTGVIDRFVNMMSEAPKTSTLNSSAGGERTIILQLEGRELKRFVLNLMDTRLNPKKI